MKTLVSKLLIASLLIAAPLASNAASITLGSLATRQATLGDATSGFLIDGNPQSDDIDGAFGGSWTKVGDVNAVNGLSDGYLTITLDVGEWGGQPPASGTWTISDAFFDIYGSAVISMHVGGGGQDPEGFAWLTSGTSGTWSYDANGFTSGGGLSNLGLWGSGEPTRVPDGGATAVLLGLSLVALSFYARRRAT